MDIIYMGTPDFAVPALEKLIGSDHDVKLVITRPDAERDRGKKVQATPVKEKAVSHGIPVMQPVKLRTDEETLASWLGDVLQGAGITPADSTFPVIQRKGRNEAGHLVTYYLNYSAEEQSAVHPYSDGTELFSGEPVKCGEEIRLPAWGVKIVESCSI